MKSKICHVTSVHSAKDGRIFQKECRSLAMEGYEVTLIAPNASDEVVDDVKIIGVHCRKKDRLWRSLFFPRLLFSEALKIDADLYHLHDPELLPIALKLKKKHKKVIFDSHEFYSEQIKYKSYIPKLVRNLIAALYSSFETYVCRRIDAVVQVCTLRNVNYFEGKAKKTVFVRNTIPLSEITNSEIQFKNRNKYIHVGSLTHIRGVTHLVKASARTKGKLLLVGNFSPDLYRREVENMEEFKQVDYKGFLHRKDVTCLMNECFAGISTLLNVGQYVDIDTFATKVYEYMAAGIPVVMSATPFTSKMNDKYHFGICVNPENIDEIAEAINYLYENPDIAEEMGCNGKKALREEFNWGKDEKRLFDLYTDILIEN